jgi:hypothetical protein
MRILGILSLIGMLVGCSYSTIYLKHPETDEIVKCGPYRIWTYTGPLGTRANELKETKCIENFKAVGYQKMPDMF